jgi:A/G-specific adenine glycosylase
MPATNPLERPLAHWFARHARDLPWRSPDRTPWQVMVSEYMLQQTPVDRVLPAWHAWIERWPTPADCAAAPADQPVRMWGRLGYPRRARRLHEAARLIVSDFGGQVPADRESLLSLPGIGDYTAAAIMSFAFGTRAIVLDTNIRRVIARAVTGQALPLPHVTAAERMLADDLTPRAARASTVWNAAIMELGALICTARAPKCEQCPLADQCRWLADDRPEHAGPVRRQARFEGSDRQARGALMRVLRDAPSPVPRSEIEAAWSDSLQRDRALASLIAEGMVERLPRHRYGLPAQ